MLQEDSDWYDQEITLADASGFRVGDGICLRTRDDSKREVVLRRTLVARTGNRFKLDRALRENFWRHHETSVELICPLVTGEYIADVAIESLVLDGNREKNANLNGNYGGCIFLQDCRRIAIRGVTARNNNGDGISFQICHDVVVENCTCTNNVGLGVHPGSGSQRPIVRNNQLRGNEIGLFFCWGVKYGLAENNTIVGNAIGVSIGHHDTDNLVTGNLIQESKRVGILFRPERGKDFAGHRNRIVKNRVIDNAGQGGAAIDVQGGTESIVLADNEIVENRAPAERIAIRLGAQTHDIRISGNTIRGFAEEVRQMR
jgi:parallel beta-helix repeat protein